MTPPSASRTQSRRALLARLAATGAALGGAAALPDRWTRPIVDAVVVPLHAQASPMLLDPARLAGRWEGTWVDETPVGGSGTATLLVAVNPFARTFQLTLDLNGPVFAAADPAPQFVTGSWDATGAMAQSFSPRFANLGFHLTPTGTLTGQPFALPECCGGTWNGFVTHTTIVIHYSADVGMVLPSTPYAGTLTLAKI
jgi:hypothetical protein